MTQGKDLSPSRLAKTGWFSTEARARLDNIPALAVSRDEMKVLGPDERTPGIVRPRR
jgi:hypothetical protein